MKSELQPLCKDLLQVSVFALIIFSISHITFFLFFLHKLDLFLTLKRFLLGCWFNSFRCLVYQEFFCSWTGNVFLQVFIHFFAPLHLVVPLAIISISLLPLMFSCVCRYLRSIAIFQAPK